MVKKRGFFTQFIRHLVQIAAFILFPGLFITVFSAVRDLAAAVMDGQFSLAGLFPQILLVLMVLLITALWGRFFCGFLCSFGMLQEALFFFTRRVLFKKTRIPPRFDAGMKYLKYGILAFITAGVWILALPVDSSWSPWGVFGMLVSGNFSVISRAIPTAGFVLLLVIVAGSLFVERFFCRYLCPLGALFAIVSRKRLYKIKRRSDTCTNCGLCIRTCSMGIHIPEKDEVVSGECIQCMQCLAICPKESLSANPAGAVAGTAAAAAIGGTVVVGNLVSFPVSETISNQQMTEKAETKEITKKAENGKYKDGVYTGVGEGFRGTTQVQVTVEDGYIEDITVLSFQDDREFFQKAQSAVINDIITEQTFDVSAVSGATFSSSSIMDAVADALGSGLGELEQPVDHSSEDAAGQPVDHSSEDAAGQPVDHSSEDAAGQPVDHSSEDAAGQPVDHSSEDAAGQPVDGGQKSDQTSGLFSAADGTYEGMGRGLRGITCVSVTVEGGMITDITIKSYEDDAAYFTRAQDAVISEILRTQSLDVQAVSGATFSSNSIMDAVADALGAGAAGQGQPVGSSAGDASGGESGSETVQQGAGAGNGSGAGQQGADEGNGSGAGQQGAGQGNGSGAGHQGNGRHGRGGRGGSGGGGHRGKGN